MQGRGRATRSLTRAPKKSSNPIEAARRGAASRTSRQESHNQYPVRRIPGAQRRLELERVSANQSSVSDCPVRLLMARKRDSSTLIWLTIKRHPSFVNREPSNNGKWSVWSLLSVWSIWLSGLIGSPGYAWSALTAVSHTLSVLVWSVRAVVNAHREFPVHRLVTFHLGFESPMA